MSWVDHTKAARRGFDLDRRCNAIRLPLASF
jgi:hypothetical protein